MKSAGWLVYDADVQKQDIRLYEIWTISLGSIQLLVVIIA